MNFTKNSYQSILAIILALLAGLILGLSWPPSKFPYFILLAFVPLFYLENIVKTFTRPILTYLLLIYVSMLIWNLISTIWLWDLNPQAAPWVMLLNALIGTIPFIIYRFSKPFLPNGLSLLALVSSWLSMELLIQKWGFAYPYLILGNGLSTSPEIIQWYEYTGVLGGSAWILLMGILGLQVIKARFNLKTVVWFMACLILPIVVSISLKRDYENYPKISVGALHTSVDARTEKYDVSVLEVMDHYLSALKHQDGEISLVVLPESAITEDVWIEEIHFNEAVDLLRYKSDELHADIVTGSILAEFSKNPEHPLAQELPDGRLFNLYTGALMLKHADNSIALRTKEKLVPIEETIPYPKYFTFLRSYFSSLGGFIFITREHNQDIFETSQGHKFLYLICYESIFPDFTRKKVGQGASFIAIGLNESWYKNRKAAKQFMHYAVCRAIENRRAIARSSNDGISCFISPNGKIIASEDKYETNLLIGSIPIVKKKTIYTIFGDWLGIIGLISTIGLMLLALYRSRN